MNSMHTDWSTLREVLVVIVVPVLEKFEYNANQLNTCKHFLSLQNGLSVWFTKLHNHGEESCPEDNHQKTPLTRRVSHKHSLPKKLALHRLRYPSMLPESWVEGNSVEEKDAQPTALRGLSSKIDSRIWVNLTRNSHHTQTCQEIWLQLSHSSF